MAALRRRFFFLEWSAVPDIKSFTLIDGYRIESRADDKAQGSIGKTEDFLRGNAFGTAAYRFGEACDVEAHCSGNNVFERTFRPYCAISCRCRRERINWRSHLGSKEKNPRGRSHLHECIQAETVIAYATPRVVSEVEEYLPTIANDRRLSIETCLAEWTNFKALLRIEDPDPSVIEKYAGGQDPDDAPTIALAEIIGAIGIFTKDTDIAAMGGTCIPISFILEARNYSRQAALNVTIQAGGYCIAVGAGYSFTGAIAVFERCATWFRGLRAEVKLLLLLAIILAFVHPRSRALIVAAIKTFAQRFPYRVAAELFQCAMLLGDMVITNPATPPRLPNREEANPDNHTD